MKCKLYYHVPMKCKYCGSEEYNPDCAACIGVKHEHEADTKLDANKPDTSLLLMFGRALLAVAEVGTRGLAKHTRGGWQTRHDGRTRYTAAMLRHLLKESYEDFDGEDGVLHSAAVAYNALVRLELQLRETERERSTGN